MKRTLTIDARAPLAGTPRNLPLLRAECRDIPRPCPYVSCRYHLEVEIGPSGNLKFAHPIVGDDGELTCEPQGVTCALDVADSGGAGLEQIAEWLGLTGERARQIEAEALVKLARNATMQSLAGVRGESRAHAQHSTVAALAKTSRRVRIPAGEPEGDDE